MVSATTRTAAHDPLASLTTSSAHSNSSPNSFAQQLATALEGYLKQSNHGAPLNINVSEVAGRNSGGSQFLVTVTPGSATAASTKLPNRTSPTGRPASSSTGTASTSTSGSNVPTMLGMGPVAGAAPLKHVTTAPTAASTAPVTEGDAYWAAQPAAVQALRNMPDGEAKDKLALKLANQGYSIDTQIMVWGWDPQMTMTVRANQGYSWVPGYGQANIPVGPGLSMPDNPNSYNPGNPPVGAIQVSTAFAVGTIQNPLVQSDTSST